MAIYEGSRYSNVYTHERIVDDKEIIAFNIRQLPQINYGGATKHRWIMSDRLDILADRYYGDPQYWWFLLDANPKYMEEHEIRNGDLLLIPTYEELRKVVDISG